jgi:ATP-dependent helicase YprA (DUF1998 family)
VLATISAGTPTSPNMERRQEVGRTGRDMEGRARA